MARLSTPTEGFYCQTVSASGLPDGGDLRLEVATLSGTVVATVPLAIQNGTVTVDVPRSTTQAWPDNAKFRLVATTPSGFVTSKWMENPGLGIEWVRRSALPAGTSPYLNATQITGSSHTFTWTDPFGIEGRRYDLWIDEVDMGLSVAYPTTSWPVTNLPLDGRALSVVLKWWDDIATINEEPAKIFSAAYPVTLSGNGTTLSSSSYTLSWTDPSGTTGRQYRAYVNGAASGSIVSYPATSILLKSLPTDGSQIIISLRYWDLLDASDAVDVSINVTATIEAAGESIYSRTTPQIYSVPTITPTTTTIISSGDTAGLWAALRAASPGDAVLGEAGGVYGADPLNLEDLVGTLANPIWFGGDSDISRMRIECAGGVNWRDFRAPATGTPVYPGNTHARAMWWEGCSHIEGFNFEIWYSAYWGAMLGGADAGNSAAGLACTNIHFENFLVDGYGGSGIKWLNGSDAGLFEHFEIRNGDALTEYGGEPFYFGSGNYPASGALGCTLRHFEMHHCNGELDVKRLTRGPLLFEYGHIHHQSVHSQGAITLGINNHDYGGNDPDITLRHLLIEDITNRAYNGNGITAAVPFTAEEVVIRNTVDDCIAIYGDYNTTDIDVNVRNCILIPATGKLAVNDRAQTFSGLWPNMIRSGNYVPSAEVVGNENAIEDQPDAYTEWTVSDVPAYSITGGGTTLDSSNYSFVINATDPIPGAKYDIWWTTTSADAPTSEWNDPFFAVEFTSFPATFAEITNLPTDGQTIYVRLNVSDSAGQPFLQKAAAQFTAATIATPPPTEKTSVTVSSFNYSQTLIPAYASLFGIAANHDQYYIHPISIPVYATVSTASALVSQVTSCPAGQAVKIANGSSIGSVTIPASANTSGGTKYIIGEASASGGTATCQTNMFIQADKITLANCRFSPGSRLNVDSCNDFTQFDCYMDNCNTLIKPDGASYPSPGLERAKIVKCTYRGLSIVHGLSIQSTYTNPNRSDVKDLLIACCKFDGWQWGPDEEAIGGVAYGMDIPLYSVPRLHTDTRIVQTEFIDCGDEVISSKNSGVWIDQVLLRYTQAWNSGPPGFIGVRAGQDKVVSRFIVLDEVNGNSIKGIEAHGRNLQFYYGLVIRKDNVGPALYTGGRISNAYGLWYTSEPSENNIFRHVFFAGTPSNPSSRYVRIKSGSGSEYDVPVLSGNVMDCYYAGGASYLDSTGLYSQSRWDTLNPQAKATDQHVGTLSGSNYVLNNPGVIPAFVQPPNFTYRGQSITIERPDWMDTGADKMVGLVT